MVTVLGIAEELENSWPSCGASLYCEEAGSNELRLDSARFASDSSIGVSDQARVDSA